MGQALLNIEGAFCVMRKEIDKKRDDEENKRDDEEMDSFEFT
jgi:hypothetical protein